VEGERMSIRSNAASVVFENVSKVYSGAVRAVDNVSLSVEPGELVTLLGPSGCGKTTTLRMIAGLERATEGRILIGDRDVTGLPATDRDVSMVFQSYALFPHMTVFENVAYGLESSRAPKAEVQDCRRSFPAASSSALPWPAPWCWSRRFCCSTSRCPTWTPGCDAGCARISAISRPSWV
jgi:ABC-type branched-subunit amino acid transport system ATPase component